MNGDIAVLIFGFFLGESNSLGLRVEQLERASAFCGLDLPLTVLAERNVVILRARDELFLVGILRLIVLRFIGFDFVDLGFFGYGFLCRNLFLACRFGGDGLLVIFFLGLYAAFFRLFCGALGFLSGEFLVDFRGLGGFLGSTSGLLLPSLSLFFSSLVSFFFSITTHPRRRKRLSLMNYTIIIYAFREICKNFGGNQ